MENTALIATELALQKIVKESFGTKWKLKSSTKLQERLNHSRIAVGNEDEENPKHCQVDKTSEVNMYFSITSLSINGLNAILTGQELVDWIKNRTHLSVASKKCTSPSKTDRTCG